MQGKAARIRMEEKKKKSQKERAEEKAEKEKNEKPETPQTDEPEQGKGESSESELSEKLEKLQEEFESHKEQHLRVLAEYDNFRKRTQNEKTTLYNSAVADTVQAILPIADNIERALSQENASAEDMRKGVEMIETQIRSAFEKLQIREIGSVGEPFDPNFHNAVSHVEDDSLGENVIAAVFQKGYALGDRVVRHAMVQVAN